MFWLQSRRIKSDAWFKFWLKEAPSGALNVIVVFYKQATPNGVKDKSELLAPAEPPISELFLGQTMKHSFTAPAV